MTTVIECHAPVAGKLAPNLKALKAKQQAAWSSGDYAVIGTTLQIVGEQLVEAMDLRAGQTVLDVAAGNGNVTLAAARRWCEVTSTDYVESLLARGRKRAEAEGLQVKFQIADAEDLPFADASFDAVVSTFGGMSAPIRTAPLLKWYGCASLVAASASPIGRPKASSAICSGRSASTCRRRVALSPRRFGARGIGCKRRSAPRPSRSPPRRATLPSATARRSTSSTSSGPTTDRCLRPLQRSMRPAGECLLATSLSLSDASIPPATRRWLFRASTSRLSSPNDETLGVNH